MISLGPRYRVVYAGGRRNHPKFEFSALYSYSGGPGFKSLLGRRLS